MKQLFTLVLVAMAFVACTQNDVEELSANRADVPETLTVGFEGGDTRIELNEALKTVWTEGDEVSVYFYSDANQKWQYQGETGERLGMLRRVDAGVATTQTDYVVVAYPYNTSYTLNRINANLIASLPAVQSYKEGSYGSEGNIMVAQSEFTQFSLKSVIGWLRVELTGEGESVKSITLRGNAGEQVAGLIYVDTATAEATLASEMGEASDEEQVGGVGGGLDFDAAVFTEVTLDCGEGIELGAEATAFYVALLPQTFEKGMTIYINYANAEPQTLVCDSSITIRRNHIAPVNSAADSELISKIFYTATALVEPNSSAFNVAIVSNEWNEATGEGVITFDGELTTIGYEAFDWCRSLTSVTIPDSVTTIGDKAFYWCDSLTSVTIPDSVTTIGGGAFYDCASLTSVTISDSVTTIGDYAFGWCSSLTSVTIPDSVTTIGDEVFAYCNSLVEFKGKFAEDGGRCLIIDGMLNAFALGCGVTEYTIPDSVTTIGVNAFYDCASLTSVTIPDSVTTIGGGAFSWCESLTSVTIPDSVTTIGNNAFYYCSSLTSVTIPNSVTTIGDSAFAYCDDLTSVTIGDSVTTIGEWAFSDCISLTSVYCKATTPPSLGDYVFKYWDSGYVNIGCAIYVPAESVEAYKAASGWSDYAADIVGYDFETGEEVAISNKLFYTATALVEPDEATAFNVAIVSNEWNEATGKGIITFDGELTTIGDYAFCDCDNLTSVTIPDSVTTIGEAAFAVCSNLAEFKGKFAADGGRCLIKDNAFIAYAEASGTEYTIPDSVTTIGNWAFYFCSSLTSVTIPDSVTTIGDEAFVECHSLTSITIGDSVTTIGDYAFYGCTSLTSVTIPNSVTTIGWYAFYYCTSLTSVTIPDSVTTIGEGAFGWCSSLTSVTIPDSVTTIGDGAFVGCSSLTSVTIPDSVTTIGDEVFADCSNLAEFKGKFAANGGRCLIKDNAIIAYAEASGTEYTIPDSVTTIGEGVFDGCESLTSVTIPDSVTTIGNCAFYDCGSLTSVTIPDSVTTIGNYAFAYCDDLTSVYCKAPTPPTLGFYVFDDNASGRKIYVPAESVEAYKAATNWSEYAADIVGYDFE